VPKICHEYRKLCKNVQKYRKPNGLKNHHFTGVHLYIFRLLFFLCLLHTEEVTGPNPLSLAVYILVKEIITRTEFTVLCLNVSKDSLFLYWWIRIVVPAAILFVGINWLLEFVFNIKIFG